MNFTLSLFILYRWVTYLSILMLEWIVHTAISEISKLSPRNTLTNLSKSLLISWTKSIINYKIYENFLTKVLIWKSTHNVIWTEWLCRSLKCSLFLFERIGSLMVDWFLIHVMRHLIRNLLISWVSIVIILIHSILIL